ncbi:sulfite exporter TauE/SafE family protein [Rheinheimera sediminis]|nr:sulfite exporter TauE/SafE family protein [Rheinheimera sp. YQF-1]
MFESKVFRLWFIAALTLWFVLFYQFNQLSFLLEHWYYPAIMVAGAFVAGVTPEGGGAVAFPVLNIFLNIDRTMARDFSLMIQSVGMTSASIFILSHKANRLKTYRPLLLFIPLAFIGFVLGMQLLQQLPVYIMQALFLSLITSFAVVYSFGKHRGSKLTLELSKPLDFLLLLLLLLAGGMCASLFGTGADIILFTVLVTHFRMQEKVATHMSIMLMAAISLLGFGYRHFVDQALTGYQVQTWLCAYPVVLLMAPLGAYVLHLINKEIMLYAIAVLNIGQLLYFLCHNPSLDKLMWASAFTLVLSTGFYILIRSLSRKVISRAQAQCAGPV